MEATLAVLDASQAQDSTRYKSRPGALAWFFRKSREQWRLKAEIADKRVAALEAENVELRTRLSVLEPEKKTPAPAFLR